MSPEPAAASQKKGTRTVALIVVLFILAGISVPFLVVGLKTRTLKNNETATLQLLRNYIKAQDAYFAQHKEYAQKLSDLGGEFAALPDIAPRGGAVNGYQFRIMHGESAAGGSKSFVDEDGKMTRKHGLLATPGHYGYTGRDTFFVSGDEIWFLDLGPRTEQAISGVNHLTIPEGAAKVR